MKISLVNGAPALLLDSMEVLLGDISCGLRYTKDEASAEVLQQGAWHMENQGSTVVAVSDNAKIFFESEGRGIRLRTEYIYRGEDLERTDELIVMRGKLSERVKKLFGNTLHEANGLGTLEMLSDAETVCFCEGDNFKSGDFAALELDSGAKYIAGCLTYNEFFSAVNTCEDGTVELLQTTERMPVTDGYMLKSDIFCVLPCDDIVTALPEYCALSAKHVGVSREKKETPSGSCTWYYYLSDINEDIVSRAADDLSAVREKLPMKYMQIDDGWQVFYGQWEPNERFPSGMKAAADKILSQGLVPGLWFAPLWANKARVRTEHPEYFPEGRDGSRSICFDLSVPEACEYMKEVYRTVTEDWGYRYLKLDGITTVLGTYKYKDPTFNSLKNYKKCLQIIDEATPDDTYILACTAPLGAAAGLADGMRVSCDVAGSWESICKVFKSVLKRYYYHNIFYTNDSDCLSIRTKENEDSECSADETCTRNDGEIKTFISATAAAGGIFMSSDKLRLLTEEQLDTISYLFPQNTEAALPLDLMDSNIPGVLDCKTRGKIHTAMLINWENEPKEISFELDGDSHVFEFWTKSYKGVFKDKYTAVIPPHCCEVLHIAPAGESAVIASGSCLVPQISQSLEGGKLSVTFSKKGETVYFACDGSPTSSCPITSLGGGIYSVTDTENCGTVEISVG